jgi:hypothetical protein
MIYILLIEFEREFELLYYQLAHIITVLLNESRKCRPHMQLLLQAVSVGLHN